MTAPSFFQFDEIGTWSELKLDIIEKYGAAYTKAFSNVGKHLKKYYIDGFSGAGVHRTKQTRAEVDGSPTRALKITPPFDGFYFIDMNSDKTAHLRTLCAGRTGVEIHTGDTNPYLIRLLPTIRYNEYKRALCLLDPYGLHLDWDVMQCAGQAKTVDMFLNFPIMDMNRNAIWREPEKASSEDIARMNRFWGDDSWKKAAYVQSRQSNLFSDPALEKQPNTAIVAAFRERLQKVAGFKYVPEPLPMTNARNAVVYYLFFASAKPVAQNIIEGIFKKHRGK
jgi:three-Cys-motif partner protein